jgi:hypothetical protein
MNIEDMTLEDLSIAACTSDSSQPELQAAAQAELDRIGFKSFAEQFEELKQKCDKWRDIAESVVYELRRFRTWPEGTLKALAAFDKLQEKLK